MLLALLICETLLLALLSILVVGLLRSHAEILRRLGPEGSAEGSAPAAAPRRQEGERASDVSGIGLDGDAIQVGLAPGSATTLLAFLGSGCATCATFWRDLGPERRGEVPGDARLVIVVKGPDEESPSRLRELAPPSVPLVMSSAAWEAYRVPGSPYFVHVDGASGTIAGEGAATSWQQVQALLGDALADIGAAKSGDGAPRTAAPARAARAERELERAGIGPGHPSLYPSRSDGGRDE